MAEHDWKQLLEDPEIEGIIRRVRFGPGLRLYRPPTVDGVNIEFDDLESWLWDEAVNVAMRYSTTTFHTAMYDARRHWTSWLYVSLKNAVLNGKHLNSMYGRRDSAKRELHYATVSIEEATEAFGDSLGGHTRGGHARTVERTWRLDPVTQLIHIENLERLVDRARERTGTTYTVESNGICTENLCTAPTFTAGLCARHYHRDRTAWGDQCSVDTCTQGARAKGLCVTHYNQARNADPNRTQCSADGCDRPVSSRGMCGTHYSAARLAHGDQWKAEKAARPKVCQIPGCDDPVRAKGQCDTHYSQYKRARRRGAA